MAGNLPDGLEFGDGVTMRQAVWELAKASARQSGVQEGPQEAAMRVEVVSAFCLGGGRDVFEGEILELPEREARTKIVQGYVRPAKAEPSVPPGEEILGACGELDDGIADLDPTPVNRDPRRGRRA